MHMQSHEYSQYSPLILPDQVMPLIYDCAGEDAFDGRIETLKTLAFNYLLLRKRPTRIVFHTVSDVLGIAKEQGIRDHELNHFLSALENYSSEH